MTALMVITTTEAHSIDAAMRRDETGRGLAHRYIDPKTGQIATTGSLGRLAGLKVNHVGRVVFVDVVGYANRLPVEAPWWDTLAALIYETAEDADVPIGFPRRFGAFTDRCGPHPDRLLTHQFASATGIIGAQHLPGGALGEPGDMNRLIELLADPHEVATGMSPGFLIQSMLHNAGFFGGPITGEVDVATVDAVAAALRAIDTGNVIVETQAGHVRELVETLTDQMEQSGRMDQAAEHFKGLVAAIYGEDAAARVLAAILA